ncbi:MAG: MscL family protein, partial [Pseudomonadota bacterium]
VDFSSLFVPLDGKSYESLATATEAGAATLNYGLFINAVISFLIVAWVVFLIVRSINKMKKAEEEAPKEDPVPPREEVLLEEIRDLLKTQRS